MGLRTRPGLVAWRRPRPRRPRSRHDLPAARDGQRRDEAGRDLRRRVRRSSTRSTTPATSRPGVTASACRSGTPHKRLALSGTPFRSDAVQIPFVRYDDTAEGDLAHADYTYGYADALRDGGVVRPVYFPRVDGEMEWTTAAGDVMSANFQDELTKDQMSMRLRTALSLEGEWMPTVLAKANDQLRDDPHRTTATPVGLVIAIDQDHAQAIARLLRDRFGVPADVVVSDDPSASKKIAEFADNDRPWLVSVRMVSEGVDIPRLRVGVFATTTSTELFFRQAVGRFVRWQSGRPSQKAYVYIPDDPRLRSHAFTIAEARRHVLRPPDQDDGDEFQPDRRPGSTGRTTTTPNSSRCSRWLRRRRPTSRCTPSARTACTTTASGSRRTSAPRSRSQPIRRRTRPARARSSPTTRRSRLDLPEIPTAAGLVPHGFDERRRDQGRPADPQRPRRETARRHHRLEPRQGAGRDEPPRRSRPGWPPPPPNSSSAACATPRAGSAASSADRSSCGSDTK